MDESILSGKQELRRIARARIQAMLPEAQAEGSRRVCELIFAQEVFRGSKSILLYMPLAGEPDVRPILKRATEEGKEVALPRFLPETGTYAAFLIEGKPLVPGLFGAMEPTSATPISLNRLDLIVVPGVGFDLRGRRLGRGKGFYDRMLSEASGVKCGVCFDEQILEGIPVEPHDVGVQFLATPSRWLDCRGSSPDLR